MSGRPTVRWANGVTGEIKERQATGVDRWTDEYGLPQESPWEVSALDLALAQVPDLVAAIKAAFANGMDLSIGITEVAR